MGVEGLSLNIGPAAKEDEKNKTTDTVTEMARERICSKVVLPFNVIHSAMNRKSIAAIRWATPETFTLYF